MDIKDKWVHFEDSLELEMFMTICEEKGVVWKSSSEGFSPRLYLKEELDIYIL